MLADFVDQTNVPAALQLGSRWARPSIALGFCAPGGIRRGFMTTFAELRLPAALFDAIAARGYVEAMPVQVAVMDEEHRDRDLLVSSQTGSGKTLAFGLLLARALPAFAPDSADGVTTEHGGGKKGHATRLPLGLVIAPTRELANQVRSELAWLFAGGKVHVAAFTGGSDLRQDLRKLHAGVDVVVGTPGRLVDLLTREVLHLEGVKVAVLDEADEMLDMGFREDLQTLLGAATARTRTHMFSATLPKPILSLAANYQREAVRVDARKLGQSAGGAHEDIEHVAHLIAVGDRTAAVINVLRAHPDQRTIVFGTTRDGVADLHRQLVRTGFRAVVLSGDRAQAERNRALSALREGEAQVLVATNVAARGLDLPEVDLVVHADLPLNTEALTHRSGRTGRAGRKGTSVLIASMAERRKAERLLGAARVKVSWTVAPDADAIAREGEKRFEEQLVAATNDGASAPDARVVALADRMVKHVKKDALLHALLAREIARIPRGESLKPVDLKIATRDTFRPAGPPVDREVFTRDAVRFRVNLGSESRAEAAWLLPLICRRGGVTRREVGAIRVTGPRSSEFEIAGHAASDFALASAEQDPRAPHVVFERMDGRAAEAPRRRPQHFTGPRREQFTDERPAKSHYPGARGPKREAPWQRDGKQKTFRKPFPKERTDKR